ncbi:MAG: hypothetical protein KIT27_10770 [Legionellales bacterium]|nr:hypothetical protein [Legionellales bacterium]
MTKALYVMIPELFSLRRNHEITSSQSFIHLTQLILSTPMLSSNARNYEQVLSELFFPQQNAMQGLAALRGLADGLNTHDNFWWCCDPVELVLDQKNAFLHPLNTFNIASDYLLELRRNIQNILDEVAWQFYTPRMNRWYLSNLQFLDIPTPTLSEMSGKKISVDFPQTPMAKLWGRLLTEIQMVLFQFQQQYKIPANLNSVWLWGGGKLPTKMASDWQWIYGDEPVLNGICQYLDLKKLAVPFEHCLNELTAAGRYFIFFDPKTQLQTSDPTLFLPYLEETFWPNLFKWLKYSREHSCWLYTGEGSAWQFTNRSLPRWWRFHKPRDFFALLEHVRNA